MEVKNVRQKCWQHCVCRAVREAGRPQASRPQWPAFCDELSRLLTAYEGLEGYCAELSEDNKNIMETDEAAKAKTVLEEAKVVLKEHDKLDED